MLTWMIVTPAVSTFSAMTFALWVGYGVIAPATPARRQQQRRSDPARTTGEATMNRSRLSGARELLAIVLAVVVSWAPLAAQSQTPTIVTVQELIKWNHRLSITVGTEVLFSDPHFERVWFPPAVDAPRVERVDGGFRALSFAKPGTYRGRFTIAGGHRSNDVYPMIVTVTER